jgi:hypothetical protein
MDRHTGTAAMAGSGDQSPMSAVRSSGSRRFSTLVVTSIVTLSLLGGDFRPLRAYEGDHYYLTYYLALQLGFSPRQAYQIASAAYSIDWDPDTGPMPSFSETISNIQGSPADHLVSKWARFHAFDDTNLRDLGPNAVFEAKNEHKVRLRDLGSRQGNPGVVLHFVQDFYAHAGWENVRGHALAGHLNDFLADSRENRRGATLESIAELDRFRRQLGVQARNYDVVYLFEEAIDTLSAANPIAPHVPSSATIRDRAPDELEYSMHITDALLFTLSRMVVSGKPTWADFFGLWADEINQYYPELPRIAADLMAAPDGQRSSRVLDKMIEQDRYDGRLPSHPLSECRYTPPTQWIQFDHDENGAVNHPSFQVEMVELELLEPRVRWEEVASANNDVLAAQVTIPYRLTGIGVVPRFGGGKVLVYEEIKLESRRVPSDINRPDRPNGSFEFGYRYQRNRADFEAGIAVEATVHVCGLEAESTDIFLKVAPREDRQTRPENDLRPSPRAEDDDWDTAVASGDREAESTSTSPSSSSAQWPGATDPATPSQPQSSSSPVVPEGSVADAAGRVRERVDRDRERQQQTAEEIAETLGAISDALSQGRTQPSAGAPVVPAGSDPRTPAAGSSTGNSGQGQPDSRQDPGRSPTANPGCVIFELKYGSDGHFLTRVTSGRPNDAIAYYVMSVPAEQSFADGSGCSGTRSCHDFYIRNLIPGVPSTVLGSYRSLSAARRAAKVQCPNPM